MEESFELYASDESKVIQLPDVMPALQNVGNLKSIITDLEDTFFDSLESDLSKDLALIHEQIQGG